MRNSLARLRKLVLLLSDHHQKLLMVLAIKLKLELLVGIYILSCHNPRRTRLMQHHPAMKCGVPVVPGTPGPVASYKDGEAFIKEYGFPGTHP